MSVKSTLTPVGAREFVRAISCAATPVTIVTTDADGLRWGQTVSAVSRVSDEPAVLGVCINRRSPINAAIRACGSFNVSLLGPEHHSAADSFAGRLHAGRPAFTFLDDEWRSGANGLPVFVDSVAAFECELHSITDVGSHHLYLGEVRNVAHTDAEPLLHMRGSYRTLAAHTTEGHHA
ncbi:oxidoreductase [Mycolicibacterium vaccae ATCC 25954]|uniref:Oxidoreductase n=1 Tax=Mycolicibacterium vaccae ATCC 25954 TaxID=1194972 RepID=K0ULM1_MYCVA|nr:oxidoreductase [Mycolicibacterium vaccae 95051]EJZ05885.1 oxidoreductase [Mycolicibacterium vaccae ATCC 25954]